MDETSARVARQYESFAYPQPADDLQEMIDKGGYYRGDPSLYAPVLWPEGRPAGPLRILVAGCGTIQAAYTAYMNPRDEVVGIDLSETSIEHERRLKERHQLDNLTLHRGDLTEVSKLGGLFDVIICTGVLHHMADPDAGLRALRDVLEPEGVMVLMLYGEAARVGVYMLQDVFRRLGVEADEDGAATVRSVLEELPPRHCAQPYIDKANELQHDYAIVDTFLHPQDRPFSVPQIFEFLDRAGLKFERWIDSAEYWRNLSWDRNSKVAELLDPLPPEQHWAVVELLRQGAAMHNFIARHKDASARRNVDFGSADWRSFTPHRAPEFKKIGSGEYQRYLYLQRCAPIEEFIIDGINGERTIGEILSHPRLSEVPADQLEEAGRLMFEHQWKLGHIMISLPPTAKK